MMDRYEQNVFLPAEYAEKDAVETREPAVAYYSGGNAIAGGYEAGLGGEFAAYGGRHRDEDNEPIPPERADAIRKDPKYIAWSEDFYRSIEEGVADARAGRTLPFCEAVDRILLDIENGTI